MAEFSYIGKSVTRIDGVEKVTGMAKFSTDIQLPGMLFAMILRSPYPHARILKIDTSKAEKLPGVKAIITIEDVPRIPYGMTPFLGKADEYIFDEKVRFVGDKVAAVAAVSENIAQEALDLIEVQYEELPPVFDPLEAMKPDASQIHPVKANIATETDGEPIIIEIGDVEKGFKEADYIFEDQYETSRQCHCCIEPHACVASFDPTGKLTVWSSTQGPFMIQRLLADLLGMPLHKIRVIASHVGGGFGSKCDLVVEPICALLARKTGRPVSLVLTREEEFYGTRTRHPCSIQLKTGVKKDGTLIARQVKALIDTGAYAAGGAVVATIITASAYNVANLKTEGYAIYTNKPVAGAYRGFGNPQITFAIESQMDHIAEALGMDPIELRLMNAKKAGDIGLLGYLVTSSGLKEALERGAERIGWQEKRRESGKDKGRWRKGIGMACMMHGGGGQSSSAVVKINVDGTVTLLTGATDIGTGSKTTLAQIVAEELGVYLEDIEVVAADTDTTPFDSGAYGTRTMHDAGNAVKAAAIEAKDQLLERAAALLDADIPHLEAKDRKIYVKGFPDRCIPIAEAAVDKIGVEDLGVSSSTIVGRGRNEAQMPSPFAAQFAEVEVDTETGKVKVLRMVAAHDVGKAINPMIVEGQIEGALQHGIGYALTEDLVVDNGVTSNPSFADYKILNASDIPDLEAMIIEPIDPTGPYGAKGVGEPGLVATAPAIANAIYHAVGVRINELPITPEKVLKVLQQKR